MKFDSNGWLDEAIEIDYLHKSMDRQGHKITHICLHGTAGGTSAQGIANYFATSNVQASAHLIIDQIGNIAQGIPLSLAAWANGALTVGHAPYLPDNVNPNLYTVAIEHCKSSTDNSNALTDIQARKSFELIQCICDTYRVPKQEGNANGGIIKHADIDPVNRARCPSTYPWDQLWAFLKGGGGKTTSFIDQAALDTWNSTAHLFGGRPLPYNTGIAKAWQSIYLSGKNMPAPTTAEFASVDWSGNPITVQLFSTIRCEWVNGQAHWYNASGGIV
jgi:N-acetyl-anhydromuramyl-L-alanine amidase AmpD